jgi:hypothetical protein
VYSFIILKERKSYEIIIKKFNEADDIKEAINYVTSTQG